MLTARFANRLPYKSVLQHRNFRLFWFGLVAQVGGQQIFNITIGWLAYDLSGSPLTLGIVNLLQSLPRIVLTLLGGALADRWDQRKLIIISQSASAVLLVALAVLALTDSIEVWHLGLGALLLGFVHSFDEPSRQSLFPHLLPTRDLIAQAVPLNTLAWQTNRILAPTLAGFLIAATGAGTSFFVAASGAALMAMMMRIIRVDRIVHESKGSLLRDVKEGTAYVWNNDVFRAIIAMSFFNSIFAMSYIYMMPLFAEDVHHVGPTGLGLLYSASGIGTIVSLLTASWIRRLVDPGKVILTGFMAFSVLLMLFAFTPWFPVALVVLVLLGFARNAYLMTGEIVLQTYVPDALRGRVMGLYGLLWSITPLGGFVLNATANFTGAPIALGGGAALVLAYVLLVGIRSRSLRGLVLPGDAEVTQPAKRG